MPNFVNKQFGNYSIRCGEDYLRIFAGYDRIISKIDRILRGKLIKSKYKSKELTIIRNFIECESHRELILGYIKNRKYK